MQHIKSISLPAWVLLACLVCATPRARAAGPPDASHPYIPPAPVLLWPNGAPGATGDSDEDKPALHPFLPEADNNTGCAIVVCPGGAFTHRAVDYEGIIVAQWFKARGIAAFVLRYRITPLYTRNDAVADGQRALQYLRAHAAEYKISPARIGMIGFSAGSELAAMIAFHPLAAKPGAEDIVDRQRGNLDFMVLGYGSSSGTVNRSNFPPTFLYCTAEDKGHATGMINLYWDLYNAGVPAEIHIFPNGEHGTGLANGDAVLGQWPELMYNWIRARNLLTGDEPASVRGHVKLDGRPLPHGSISFIPLNHPGAAPLTAYVMNTDTATGDYKLTGEARPVPGQYRVEVRQDAVQWLSNNRDPFNSRAIALDDRKAHIRAPGWGAPTIDNVYLYRKTRPGDSQDLTVEIKPGDNQLDVEVFSK
ncbi:MAG: alpha/beta hydrolase [Verrucomicrobiota bacterium]|jgi:acetyl esterase/lipase